MTHLRLYPTYQQHNPRNLEAYNSIRQNMQIKKRHRKHRIIKSKRQLQYLRKLLTNIKLPTKTTMPLVTCQKSAIGLIEELTSISLEGSTYRFMSGQIITINDRLTCAWKNLIYVLKYGDYIGRPDVILKGRVTVYM